MSGTKSRSENEKRAPDKPKYDLFSFKTGDDGALNVRQRGGDALERVFGSESPAVNEALFMQLYATLIQNEGETGVLDLRGFMPAIVRDIAPRDAIERMLAVQMAATHAALIRTGRFMANADTLPKFEAYDRAYNKLARTFTSQTEALRKHRNGGKQTVTVQHVDVREGGQAIVGNVETGGRGGHER